MSVNTATRYGAQLARSGDFAEHPPGSNVTKMWELYHEVTGAPAYQRNPWCGAAVVVILRKGGWKQAPANWISVTAIQRWGEAHGRWHRGPQGAKAGDTLVLFGPGVHTEYARGDFNPATGTIATEGGNTSPGSEGSQFNGGTLALKARQAHEIYGYVVTHDLLGADAPALPTHPADTAPAHPQYSKEPAKGTLKLWMVGPRIDALQRKLGVPHDGYYGPGTAAKVGAFKKAHSLKGNGNTIDAATEQAILGAPKARTAWPTLKRGAKGGAVQVLQRKLNKAGAKLIVDGDYGPNTARAVAAWKRRAGLTPADGNVVAPSVWPKLPAV